jgi:hypothetical protein
MITKAVIEQITSDSVILLIGQEEKELAIHKDNFGHIPDYNVGDWLDIHIEAGKVKSISLNKKETEKVRKRIQEKMDLLRKRKRNT